ncbi:MAG: hypothetical protein ABIH86_05620 [Planctomycetota bacterium]
MEECELIEKCAFFTNRMSTLPTVAKMMKKRYCEGDKDDCARYRLALSIGKNGVPANLFPHQMDIANDIIKRESAKGKTTPVT